MLIRLKINKTELNFTIKRETKRRVKAKAKNDSCWVGRLKRFIFTS
jgi:hypothetical protein